MTAGERKRLALYVTNGCESCEAALAVAERARREFLDLDVEIIDVGRSSVRPPAGVFAVPTFLLDGRVVSLGTPSWEHLSATLRRVAGRERHR